MQKCIVRPREPDSRFWTHQENLTPFLLVIFALLYSLNKYAISFTLKKGSLIYAVNRFFLLIMIYNKNVYEFSALVLDLAFRKNYARKKHACRRKINF